MKLTNLSKIASVSRAAYLAVVFLYAPQVGFADYDYDQDDEPAAVVSSTTLIMKRAEERAGRGLFDKSTNIDRSIDNSLGGKLARPIDGSNKTETGIGSGAGVKTVVIKGGFNSIGTTSKSTNVAAIVQGGGGTNMGTALTAATAADPIYGSTLSNVSLISSGAAGSQGQAEAQLYSVAHSLGFDEEKVQQKYNECVQKGGATADAKEVCIPQSLSDAGEVSFVEYVFDNAITAMTAASQTENVATWTVLKNEFLDNYGDLVTKVDSKNPGELSIRRWVTDPKISNALAAKEKNYTYNLYSWLYAIFEAHCKQVMGEPSATPNCNVSMIDENFDPTQCNKTADFLDAKKTGPDSKLLNGMNIFVLDGGPRPAAFVNSVFSAITPDLRTPDLGTTHSATEGKAGFFCTDLSSSNIVSRADFDANPRSDDTNKKMSRLKDKVFERLAILYTRAFIIREMLLFHDEILALGTVYNNRQNVEEQLNAIFRASMATEEAADPALLPKLKTTVDDIREYFKLLVSNDTILSMGTSRS